MAHTLTSVMTRRGRENRVDAIYKLDVTSYTTGGIDLSASLAKLMPTEYRLASAVSQEGEARFLTINDGTVKSWDMDDGEETANATNIKEWLLHVVGY